MTYFIAGFIIATVMKILNKYIGRQLSFGVGIVLNLCGAALILWGDWSHGSYLRESGIYGVFALLGKYLSLMNVFYNSILRLIKVEIMKNAILGGGACAGMVVGLSITADMIGNNVESGAFVYGFMSFCDKFTCGLAIMIINSISPVLVLNF
jgi:hypothetical protein